MLVKGTPRVDVQDNTQNTNRQGFCECALINLNILIPAHMIVEISQEYVYDLWKYSVILVLFLINLNAPVCYLWYKLLWIS